MSRTLETSLTDFARAASELIGLGKPLGTVEVASETGVTDRTVLNYCSGTTAPGLEWLVRFTECYGRRFQREVLRMWNALTGPIGLYVGPIAGLDPSFLDANNDGRHCGQDGRIHSAKAVSKLSEFVVGSEETQSDTVRPASVSHELRSTLKEAVMHVQAADQIESALAGRPLMSIAR